MALLGEYCMATAKGKGKKSEPNIMDVDIDAIIEKAVQKGIMIGRRQAEQVPVDAYRATERRLRALPDLKEKVKNDKEYLKDLQMHGLGRNSTDIVRFKKSGVMLDDDDIEEALIQDWKAKIARDEFEIKTIGDALTPLTSDQYYRTIPAKYFEQLPDEDVAEELHCDPSTIRKNRGRLVRRLTIRLYGSDAI